MEIRVRQLGLAAFIRMQGEPLLRFENKEFIFESSRTEAQWRTAYSNSCCSRHDSLVCDLRNFMKSVYGPREE